jgi:deoxyribose-phosphate aldolase
MIKKYKNFLNEEADKNISKYNNMIDFTYLKNDTSVDKIKEICDIAQENNFYSVCVDPKYVSDAYGFLEDEKIRICTVINFPDGQNKSEQNIKDVTTAISDGVDEIDFVLNYKTLKEATVLEDILKSKINDKNSSKEEIKEEQEDLDNKYDKIEKSLLDVADICHRNSIIFKVIIESGMLTIQEIKKACEICDRGGADFVMTSTGTKEIGAEVDKVKYMRKILPEYIKIKVSGGIRNVKDIEKFYDYADRFGTSTIIKENIKNE